MPGIVRYLYAQIIRHVILWAVKPVYRMLLPTRKGGAGYDDAGRLHRVALLAVIVAGKYKPASG